MIRDVEPDPFEPGKHAEQELEDRWFARASVTPSRPPSAPPRPHIDDPLADEWFR